MCRHCTLAAKEVYHCSVYDMLRGMHGGDGCILNLGAAWFISIINLFYCVWIFKDYLLLPDISVYCFV